MLHNRGSRRRIQARQILAAMHRHADDRAGITFNNRIVVGQLDASVLRLAGPITLADCVFLDPVCFEYSHLHSLDLRRSHLPALDLEEVQVLFDIDMTDATFGPHEGRDDPSEGVSTFRTGKSTIHGRSAQIDGYLILNRATVCGGVCLINADIGEQLLIEDARVGCEDLATSGGTSRPDAAAALRSDSLVLNGAAVAKGTFLRRSRFVGTMNLNYARLYKSLHLGGVRVDGLGGSSISGIGLYVGGTIHMSTSVAQEQKGPHCELIGPLKLEHAEVTHDLLMDELTITSSEPSTSLVATHDGELTLVDLSYAKIHGSLVMKRARIGAALGNPDSCPQYQHQCTKSGPSAADVQEAPADVESSRANGQEEDLGEPEATIDLTRAVIHGSVNCALISVQVSRAPAPIKTAMRFDRAQIGGPVFLNKAKVMGTVRMFGAQLGGELTMRDSTLDVASGGAPGGREREELLILDQAHIAGGVILEGLQASRGVIRCISATIGSTFLLPLITEVKKDPGTTGTDEQATDDARILEVDLTNSRFDRVEFSQCEDFARTAVCSPAAQTRSSVGRLRLTDVQLNSIDLLPRKKSRGPSRSSDSTQRRREREGKRSQLKRLTRRQQLHSRPRLSSVRGAILGNSLLAVPPDLCLTDVSGRRPRQIAARASLEGFVYVLLLEGQEDWGWPIGPRARYRGLARSRRGSGSLGRDGGGGGRREGQPETFGVVIGALRSAGRTELALELALERERYERSKKKVRRRLGGVLLDLFVGYGYRPLLPLLWVLGVFVSSWGVFWLGAHHGGIVAAISVPGRLDPTPLEPSSSYPAFSGWYYALGSIVLPFLRLPGVTAWRSNDTNLWGLLVRVVRLIDPIVFWGVVASVGASLARLVTRDR